METAALVAYLFAPARRVTLGLYFFRTLETLLVRVPVPPRTTIFLGLRRASSALTSRVTPFLVASSTGLPVLPAAAAPARASGKSAPLET